MEQPQYLAMYNMERDHWWFRGRRKILHSCLKTHSPVKRNNALDIGCGTGFNAALLSNFAKKVAGLDFSDTALELARKSNPNLTLIKGAFPDYKTGEKYEMITLLDVLEHIDDDARAIKRVEELLAPGGIALITIPAYKFLWTEHDALLHHKRRYTKADVLNLISKNTCLSVKKVSYFNAFMFFPILFFRFIRKVFRLKEGNSDFFMLPKPLNNILEKIFSWEAQALQFINFPFGVSIMVLLKKESASTKES